jgi:hypothetical protein
MSSRNMRLSSRATLHSDSEHDWPLNSPATPPPPHLHIYTVSVWLTANQLMPAGYTGLHSIAHI